MTDPNMPSPDEGKPQMPAATPNPDPAGGNPDPAPAPVQPAPAADPELEALRAENDRLKNDYGSSTREFQILQSQLKDKDARIAELTKQHNPTDAELREAFPEWDQMMPHEQRMARENLGLKRSVSSMNQSVAEMQARQAWEKDLRGATKQFPALKGREDDFEAFVMKPSHRQTPIEVLALAFLANNAPPQAPAAPPAPPAPSPGVQRGSAGPKAPETKPKWTGEQMQQLQQSDPKKYRDMLMAGEFDD